jgi:G:T-mismatch repair DNA endonuclease (very short patch repair protein)
MSTAVHDALKFHTNFLNYDASNRVRFSYVVLNEHHQRRCVECAEFLQTAVQLGRASVFCSVACSKKSPLTKARRAATNLEKYGVNNPFEDVEKIQQSVFDKYGVTNPSYLDSIKSKIREKNKNNAKSRMEKARRTNFEKYGSEYVGQVEEFKTKQKATNLEKYGYEHVFSDPAFQEQRRNNNIEKYGVEYTGQVDQFKVKAKQTKLDRYGDESFNNRPKAADTMMTRYGLDFSKAHWGPEIVIIMGDPVLLAQFVANKTINSAADQLGVAPTTLRNTLYDFDIVSYDKRTNQYEDLVAQLLTDLGVYFVQNDRTILQGQELDFYIPSCNLAIECNGIFWHSELMGKNRLYHVNKTNKCVDQNIKLLHVWDYQLDESWAIISSMISNMVGKTSTKIGARQTTVRIIEWQECAAFLRENHLQGEIKGRQYIGLCYNNELVSVMCFGKSRFKYGEYELLRFANKLNLNVVGGASRLLATFLKMNPQVVTLTSYANRDTSIGNLYCKLGFSLVGRSGPSYCYFKNRKVFNRMQYQKHKLQNVLSVYSPALTEWENMKNNGFNRFWNTGTLKYEFSR